MHLVLKNSLLKIALIFLLTISADSFSEVYLVGPGKDYPDLQAVADLLAAGDSVLVDGDNIYPGGVVFSNPGSTSSPIVIKGVRINNSRPIISGGTNTVHFSSSWPYTNGADNYIFEGFEIANGSFRGIFHQADNLTIRDVVVHDCAAHGILGGDQGAGSCTLEFVEVYNCGEGGSNHQIYMATDEVNHPGSIFRMEHCYLHDANGGNNVKSRAERNEIYYNWIEGAYYHELELIGPDPGGAPDGWNPKLKREDSDIVGNVLWKKGSNSNFSVVRFGGDATGETHGRYRFVNNSVISGTGSVFRCFDSLESIEIHNNIFYPIEANISINLIRTVEANWTTGSEEVSGQNNWVHENAQNIPTNWTGTIVSEDPGFTDFTNGNLYPIQSSELVNMGADSVESASGLEFTNPLNTPAYQPFLKSVGNKGLVRSIKDTIDIGAYEYNPDVPIFKSDYTNYKRGIKAYPNPFISQTLIEFTTNISEIVIFSLDGKRVFSTSLNQNEKHFIWKGNDKENKALPKGVYIIKVYSPSQNLITKITKLK